MKAVLCHSVRKWQVLAKQVTCMCMYVAMHVCMCMCIYVYVYVYVFICVLYVCVASYLYMKVHGGIFGLLCQAGGQVGRLINPSISRQL